MRCHGKSLGESIRKALRESFGKSFRESLRHLVRELLRKSLRKSLKGFFNVSSSRLPEGFSKSLLKKLFNRFPQRLLEELSESLPKRFSKRLPKDFQIFLQIPKDSLKRLPCQTQAMRFFLFDCRCRFLLRQIYWRYSNSSWQNTCR